MSKLLKRENVLGEHVFLFPLIEEQEFISYFCTEVFVETNTQA